MKRQGASKIFCKIYSDIKALGSLIRMKQQGASRKIRGTETAEMAEILMNREREQLLIIIIDVSLFHIDRHIRRRCSWLGRGGGVSFIFCINPSNNICFNSVNTFFFYLYVQSNN